MPRLTNAIYLDQRHHLMNVWQSRPELLAELAYFEQQDLHRFFAMSHEMYDDDALAYRHVVTDHEPSLPSQAGRAYARLERVIVDDAARRAHPLVNTVPAKGTPRAKKIVTVKALARPEIDARAFARALVELAMYDQKNDSKLLKKLKN